MKNSLFTRLTGLLLLAGFFYSCSSTQMSIDELLENKNYQQAITEIDNRLDENPGQPSLYIHRGKINAMLAQETDPELRPEFYSSTVEDFSSAIEFGANEGQLSEIDSLRQQYWKDEHNLGLRVSENESVSDRYHRAAIHFQNALILREEATSSLKNLAITHFKMGEIDKAIALFREALSTTDDPNPELYENLGYLYLEKGEPEQAAYYYELANKNLEDDVNLAFGLINAYISNANHEKAVDLLEPLVNNNPQNANLRNVYGTQLYEITETVINDLKEAYQSEDRELVEQLRIEAEATGEQAEEQLIEAFKRDTSNTEYLESLAVFYNNLSAQYLSLKNIAFEDHQESINEKAYTLIDFAIDYYDKLLENDPNNSQYQAKLSTLETLKERQTTSENH